MHRLYVAHSKNSFGDIHTLQQHLMGVADIIRAFSQCLIQQKRLRLAALLHDLGKYLGEFQKYIKKGGPRGSVPHAKWGALLARILKAEEISFAIDGHHAGIPNYSVWANVHVVDNAENRQQLIQLLSAFVRDMNMDEEELLTLNQPFIDVPRGGDVFIRFIFSCLTDADWLDTEKHFSPDQASLRGHPPLDVGKAIAKVNRALAALEKKKAPINDLRTSARVGALTKAHLPVGFFSLNLPTGLGKTLTSFRWALEHAKHHNLERIIIVLPYTSIIDQTAGILKKILGPGSVLEHHASHVVEDSVSEQESRSKLACENWDHPIIITTSVQFFETLFSNKPSKCRKFHNISNSIVIFDEVQTLRKDLVLPTLDMLQDIYNFMRVSVVFCTATMPAFVKTASFPGLEHITPLVDNVTELFDLTRRVEYKLLEELRPVAISKLEKILCEQKSSTLVICNTKGSVRKLYDVTMQHTHWDKVYHLSTNMCPHHRKQIIEKVTACVKNKNEKILLLATQLVEAGVDFDFPVVFRELAPLESIIQAAGRCNREGLMKEIGTVTIFQLADARYPDKFYEAQAKFVYTELCDDVKCLYKQNAFHRYYEQIMTLFVSEKPITRKREQRDFADVADSYRLIENNMQSLFILNYNDESRQLYTLMKDKEKRNIPISRQEFRKMQQYSVQVYENWLCKVKKLFEKSASGVLVWNSGYDYQTGLELDPNISDPTT